MAKAKPFDAAEYLDTPTRIAKYLEVAFESGDAGEVAAALGLVARARGMTAIANETGLSREGLYRTLSADGRPEFSTVTKVLSAMGLKLAVRAA